MLEKIKTYRKNAKAWKKLPYGSSVFYNVGDKYAKAYKVSASEVFVLGRTIKAKMLKVGFLAKG